MNFNFNSTSEMYLVRNLIDAIHCNFAKYQMLRTVIDFVLPDPNVYDVDLGNLLDRLADAIHEAEEAEKPKYEHRWVVRQGTEIINEYDDLGDAFEGYTDCYRNDWTESSFNEYEYNIFDNELQVELTNDTPAFSVEYRWDANINVECDSTSVYNDDVPDEVMESIRDEFYNGDDYGYYTYEHDGIEFEAVDDALDKAEAERRNANAEDERAC